MTDFVGTTTWPTPSWYFTGCVFRNGSTSNWHSWHTEYCMVWRQSTWINSFRYQTYQVAAAYGRRHLHFSCSFHHTVWQPFAVARFLLQHPSSGIYCLFTSSLHHLSSRFDNGWRHISFNNHSPTSSFDIAALRYRGLRNGFMSFKPH